MKTKRKKTWQKNPVWYRQTITTGEMCLAFGIAPETAFRFYTLKFGYTPESSALWSPPMVRELFRMLKPPTTTAQAAQESGISLEELEFAISSGAFPFPPKIKIHIAVGECRHWTPGKLRRLKEFVANRLATPYGNHSGVIVQS